jgi:PAS domain S-box-containing protein
VAKDGRVLWVEAHASVIKDESGRPVGMRGVTMDITERRLAEEALRESEDRYRDLVDHSHELICTHDLNGRVLSANPWAALVLGVKQEALIGLDIRTGLAPEHRHEFDDYIKKIEREGSAQGVMQVRTASGEKRIWEYHNTLRTRGVETPIIRGMAHDVTERRRALAREREARKEAEEANRLKDDFLATLSHELRTPLTSILGWSSMLCQGTLDESAVRNALEAINRNARAQAQIIDDLLDVSRIITGQLRLDVQPIELTSVIGAAVESIRPAAEAKDIRLVVELEPEVGHVLGDPMRLQQTIWNLLVNAIKFTPAGGEVRVALGRSDFIVRLSVTDTGCGIDPAFIPFVFDRFRQADGTATRRHGGLGLGLALVRHLVELHGGTVRVESEGVGRGAKFILELPSAERKEIAGAERANQTVGNRKNASAMRSPGLGGLRVLLVEDDGDSRALLNIALEAYGAVVDTASSASEALAMIKEARPDVLVSDIGMPDVDGYELIRQVRKLPPENGGLMPALALTGYAGEKDRERAILAGFQEHVSKPVEPHELAAIVAKLGQQPQQLSQ